MSRNVSRKHPRTRSILVDMGKVCAIKAMVQLPDGSVAAVSPTGQLLRPKSATITSGYEKSRADKPFKKTSEITVYDQHPRHHSDLELLQLKVILAVDTNTRDVAGTRISMTSVILAHWSPIISAKAKPLLIPQQAICYEFRNPKVEPERLGWMYAIQGFPLGSLKGKKRSVGLVVDHDLGHHAAIGSRSEEITPGFPLPPEFQLIYGSSDHRNDDHVNALIWLADRTASHCLDEVLSQPDDESCLISPQNGFCELTRVLRPTSQVPYTSMDAVAQALAKSRPQLPGARTKP